jgi:protein involved in polysaccharide export with SLBB domain
MKPRQGWCSWCLRGSALFAVLVAGCVSTHSAVEQNLMGDRDANTRHAGVLENYVLACPDVVEVRLGQQPAVVAAIGPDGRVNLGALGRPRVEGLTPPQAARQLAVQERLPRDQVRVRVAEFRSQHLLLFGEINGLQRAVPYQGQETVLDLLQRVGGITADAAPEDVYVIRPGVAEGHQPEVFHVDLRAIVLRHDQRTNLRLRPFDQVHVGATPQARVENSLPPWLRPVYRFFTGARPNPAAGEPRP